MDSLYLGKNGVIENIEVGYGAKDSTVEKIEFYADLATVPNRINECLPEHIETRTRKIRFSVPRICGDLRSHLIDNSEAGYKLVHASARCARINIPVAGGKA